MRERDGLPPIEDFPPQSRGRPRTIEEILHLGRARSALAPQGTLVEVRDEPSSEQSGKLVRAQPGDIACINEIEVSRIRNPQQLPEETDGLIFGQFYRRPS